MKRKPRKTSSVKVRLSGKVLGALRDLARERNIPPHKLVVQLLSPSGTPDVRTCAEDGGVPAESVNFLRIRKADKY